MARCPAHDDNQPSLGIKPNDDGSVAVVCFRGCTRKDVWDALDMKGPLGVKARRINTARPASLDRVYHYRDESGALLFQTLRYRPKTFRQRRPLPSGGWAYDLKGVRLVLYRLPEILRSSSVVYLVEGEKDADALAAYGLNTTTSPLGAGKWRDQYAHSLAGKDVVLVPDNDKAGRAHMQTAAGSLLANGAESVGWVDLPPSIRDCCDAMQAMGAAFFTKVWLVREARIWSRRRLIV